METKRIRLLECGHVFFLHASKLCEKGITISLPIPVPSHATRSVNEDRSLAGTAFPIPCWNLTPKTRVPSPSTTGRCCSLIPSSKKKERLPRAIRERGFALPSGLRTTPIDSSLPTGAFPSSLPDSSSRGDRIFHGIRRRASDGDAQSRSEDAASHAAGDDRGPPSRWCRR